MTHMAFKRFRMALERFCLPSATATHTARKTRSSAILERLLRNLFGGAQGAGYVARAFSAHTENLKQKAHWIEAAYCQHVAHC